MTQEKKYSLWRMRLDVPNFVKGKSEEILKKFDTITENLREIGDEVSPKVAGEITKRLREPNPKPLTVNDVYKSMETTSREPALKNGKIEFCDYFAYVKSFKKDVRPERLIGLFTKEFAGLVVTRAPLTLCPAAREKIHEILEFLR